MSPPAFQAQAYFLVGPTAVGKTTVAQCLAESMGADILSADSMLVYRGMDIGTAKPSVSERGQVPYWGLDLVDPSESFNVAKFVQEARRCFESAHARGVPVIVAGGTGLYIKALLNGLDELPDPTPEVRAHWQMIFKQQGVEGLRAALLARHPSWLQGMADASNSRRLIRALELIESGFTAPPRAWDGRGQPSRVIALEVPRSELVRRIENRVYQMYSAGLLDEAQLLLSRFGTLSTTASGAIGYAEAIDCLKGTLSKTAAMQRTIQRTRQLAKRQMTWFRHQLNVVWIPTSASDLPAVASAVSAAWRQLGPQSVFGPRDS